MKFHTWEELPIICLLTSLLGDEEEFYKLVAHSQLQRLEVYLSRSFSHVDFDVMFLGAQCIPSASELRSGLTSSSFGLRTRSSGE